MRQVERGHSARAVGPRRHGRRAAEADGAVPVPEGKDRRRTQRRGFRKNERRRTGCRQRRRSDESQTQIQRTDHGQKSNVLVRSVGRP